MAKLEAVNSFSGYNCHRAMCMYVEIPRTEKTEALIRLLSLGSKIGGMFYLHPITTIRRYVHVHTHTHTQWFCESHDLAILNMIIAAPESNSAQFECGSLGWRNVPFNQHRLFHKEPSEKCSALHLPLSSNACIFYIFLLH